MVILYGYTVFLLRRMVVVNDTEWCCTLVFLVEVQAQQPDIKVRYYVELSTQINPLKFLFLWFLCYFRIGHLSLANFLRPPILQRLNWAAFWYFNIIVLNKQGKPITGQNDRNYAFYPMRCPDQSNSGLEPFRLLEITSVSTVNSWHILNQET